MAKKKMTLREDIGNLKELIRNLTLRVEKLEDKEEEEQHD